jgi:co-chaperonin GroES (HSP10)
MNFLKKEKNREVNKVTEVKTYEPLNGRILVHKPEAVKKIGGLYLPEQAEFVPNTGIVNAVCRTIDFISPGDQVLFQEGSGITIVINQKDYLLIHPNEILMKYVEEEAAAE